MAITWRPATCIDIEPGLRIQLKNRGDALVGSEAAVESWKRLFRDPFSSMIVLESSPPIRGHRLVGFGAAVIVSPSFADAAMADPRPDINSRIIASIHSGQPVLATRSELARSNAEQGIDIVVALWGLARRYPYSGRAARGEDTVGVKFHGESRRVSDSENPL